MNKKQTNQNTQVFDLSKKKGSDKRPYEKPKLVSLGDIRDVTMGGSPGFGDSGAGTPEQPF